MQTSLHFSIEGEFITKLAREKYYIDHKLYDYYIERNRHKEANEIWGNED